ncbi:hypothetical protein Pelo_4785 [Pelomyxa schiedti]|nr:hypothetical protein Pelo_4785 [Pelomyxa schiedti]
MLPDAASHCFFPTPSCTPPHYRHGPAHASSSSSSTTTIAAATHHPTTATTPTEEQEDEEEDDNNMGIEYHRIPSLKRKHVVPLLRLAEALFPLVGLVCRGVRRSRGASTGCAVSRFAPLWKLPKAEKGTANSAALRAIERVRPVIYRELHDYWMKRPFNHIPKPVTEDKFGFIATPTSDAFIHQVKAYDKHHGFHTVKKHVVVSATAPHYCVAIGKACAGATSDKTDFDDLWSSLYPPLLKRKPDDTSFPEHATWAVLLDSGYIGASRLPNVHKVVLPRPSSHSSHYSQKDLDDLRKKRVCVECFFGRMTVLWRILLVPYPFDQQHLDVDVDIMIMLTNAHIEERDLHSGDQNSYVRICKLREKEAADVRHKRQQQRDSSMDSASKRPNLSKHHNRNHNAFTVAATGATTSTTTATTTTPIPIAIAGPATNQSLEADTTTTTQSPPFGSGQQWSPTMTAVNNVRSAAIVVNIGSSYQGNMVPFIVTKCQAFPPFFARQNNIQKGYTIARFRIDQ